jgi:hypothetical protein
MIRAVFCADAIKASTAEAIQLLHRERLRASC